MIRALHIRDCDSRFRNAAFMKYRWAQNRSSLFTEICPILDSSYSDILKVYQETSFIAKDFTSASGNSGMVIEAFTTEAHNAIVLGERDHHPLCRFFSAVLNGSPSMPGPATQPLKDKTGSRGLVP